MRFFSVIFTIGKIQENQIINAYSLKNKRIFSILATIIIMLFMIGLIPTGPLTTQQSIPTNNIDKKLDVVKDPFLADEGDFYKLSPELRDYIFNNADESSLGYPMKYGDKWSAVCITSDPDFMRKYELAPIGFVKLTGGVYWTNFLVSDLKTLRIISTDPSVSKISLDQKQIGLDIPLPTESSGLGAHLYSSTYKPMIWKPLGFTDSDISSALPTQYKTREIIGAETVRDTYGYDGSGTLVQVMDTGVDFGHTALKDVMALDPDNKSLSFDPSGQMLSITQLYSYDYYKSLGDNETAEKFAPLHTDSDGYIYLEGYTDTMQIWASNAGLNITFRDLGATYTLPGKFYVGNLPGNNTGYAFGISMAYQGYEWQFAPFLLVDADSDGDYDTLYMDFESGFYFTQYFNGFIDKDTYYEMAPFNFSIQAAHTNTNNHALSKDFRSIDSNTTGDGLADFSMGALANTYDYYNLSGRFGIGDPIIHGIDPSGRLFAHLWDPEGHGTSVSGNIAAQPVAYPLLGGNLTSGDPLFNLTGMAPGAKIIGTDGLSDTSIIYGWLWCAGYEPNNDLNWTYIGYESNHLVNISSNSWGESSFESFQAAAGFDFTSMFVDFLSVPGFLNQNHPGVLYVTSSGNGGPGYGTIKSPSQSPAALTVGASTNFWYLQNYNYSAGWYDEVVPFSDNGPSVIGYPKIDVVNIGAFDYSISPVTPNNNSRVGNFYAYDIFGGTSQAAPLTSGALAVIYQAWKDNNGGAALTPDMAKVIIKSTAKDLGYDVFKQGAGRVDIERAVRAILGLTASDGTDLFFFKANSSYLTAAERLNYPFLRQMGLNRFDFNSTVENYPGYNLTFNDDGLYGGIIAPGESVSNAVELAPQSGGINSITPIEFQTFYTETIENLSSGMNKTADYKIFSLFNKTKLQEADFVQFVFAIPYSEWDNYYLNGTNDGFPSIYIDSCHAAGADTADWVNASDEDWVRYNFGAAEEPIQSTFISGRALRNNSENFFFRARNKNYELENWFGVNFTLSVRAFKTIADTKVNVESIGGDHYNITITADPNRTPGIYQGYLYVNGSNNGYGLMPYSYSVVAVVGEYNVSGWTNIGGLNNQPYDNGLFDAIDTEWRDDVGDWRYYDLYLDNSSGQELNSLIVEINWTNPGSAIDLYLVGHFGTIITMTEFTTDNHGNYTSYPNVNSTSQRLLIDLKAYYDEISEWDYVNDTTPGLGNNWFTLVLHGSEFNQTASTLPLELYSIKVGWSRVNADEITEPVADLQFGNHKLNSKGVTVTNDSIIVTWTNVSNNPLGMFRNDLYPLDFTIFEGQHLEFSEELAAETLTPATNSTVIPDWSYVLDIPGNVDVIADLTWDDPKTDFDLMLIPNKSEPDYGADIFGGQMATARFGEHGEAHVSTAGTYKIIVDFYDGDIVNQSFDLSFTIKGADVYDEQANFVSTKTFNLSTLLPNDGLYTIQTKGYGWNFQRDFAWAFIYDTHAPNITDASHSVKLEQGDSYRYTWTISDLSDVQYELSVNGSTVENGTFSITNTIKYTFSEENIGTYNIKLVAVDTLGYTTEEIYTVIVSEKAQVEQNTPSFVVPTWIYGVGGGLVALIAVVVVLLKKKSSKPVSAPTLPAPSS